MSTLDVQGATKNIPPLQKSNYFPNYSLR